MPHQTRRRGKKVKKPKRTKPLNIQDPEALALHRELSALRIAGKCRPGPHRDKLLALRFKKLEEHRPNPTVTGLDMEARLIALREYYEKRRA